MIELNGVHGAYQANCSLRTTHKAESGSPAAASQGVQADHVDLSPDAALHVELNRAARASAQRLSQTASAERIARLQQDYSGDNCPVSGREVAQAIFRSVFGS